MNQRSPGWGARAGANEFRPKLERTLPAGPDRRSDDSRILVQLGQPFVGWPVQVGLDYHFGMDDDRFSRQLRNDLDQWHRTYDDQYDETGWKSDDIRLERDAAGEVLQRRLQAELGSGYRVELIRFKY